MKWVMGILQIFRKKAAPKDNIPLAVLRKEPKPINKPLSAEEREQATKVLKDASQQFRSALEYLAER
jgi:hypothetical protein